MAKAKLPDWNEDATVTANARRKLPSQARSYFRAGGKLAEVRLGFSASHKFRLRTKRLRYTLEFFRLCYGPGLDELLAELRRVQDYLGAISDCKSTEEIAGGLLPAGSPERKAFDHYLRERARRKAAQFRLHWRKTLGAEGADLRWCNYLRRPRRAVIRPR